jgi:hypothetical protein
MDVLRQHFPVRAVPILCMLFAACHLPRLPASPVLWCVPSSYPISLLANSELMDLQFECPNNKGALGPLALFNQSASADPLTLGCTTRMFCVPCCLCVVACRTRRITTGLCVITATAQFANSSCFGYICPITSGQQMLDSFDMKGDSVVRAFFATARLLHFTCQSTRLNAIRSSGVVAGRILPDHRGYDCGLPALGIPRLPQGATHQALELVYWD